MSKSLYAAALRRVLRTNSESPEAEMARVEHGVKVALDLISALTTLKTRNFTINKELRGEWVFRGAVTKGSGEVAIVTIRNRDAEDLIEEVAEWATSFVIG